MELMVMDSRSDIYCGRGRSLLSCAICRIQVGVKPNLKGLYSLHCMQSERLSSHKISVCGLRISKERQQKLDPTSVGALSTCIHIASLEISMTLQQG